MFIAVLFVCVEAWSLHDAYNRPVVNQNWKVALPRGGSVAYQSRSPRMRLAGPADSEKLLIWEKPDGQTQEYPIERIGGGYRDVEFRIRQDERAVWLIAWNWHKVAATFDLDSGKFTDASGYAYESDGMPDESGYPAHPQWATMTGGRSLQRKKF